MKIMQIFNLFKAKGALSPSSSGGETSPVEKNLSESLNIVSSQSTARPGCIIELETLDDSNHVIFFIESFVFWPFNLTF